MTVKTTRELLLHCVGCEDYQFIRKLILKNAELCKLITAQDEEIIRLEETIDRLNGWEDDKDKYF